MPAGAAFNLRRVFARRAFAFRAALAVALFAPLAPLKRLLFLEARRLLGVRQFATRLRSFTGGGD